MRGLLLALLVACGTKSSAPPPSTSPSGSARAELPPLDQDLPRLATRSLALYQDIVAALATAGDSCPTATTKLREIAERHAEVIAANAAVEHAGRGAELKLALQPHDATLSEAARTIMASPTMAVCVRDEAFVQAWAALVGPAPTR